MSLTGMSTSWFRIHFSRWGGPVCRSDAAVMSTNIYLIGWRRRCDRRMRLLCYAGAIERHQERMRKRARDRKREMPAQVCRGPLYAFDASNESGRQLLQVHLSIYMYIYIYIPYENRKTEQDPCVVQANLWKDDRFDYKLGSVKKLFAQSTICTRISCCCRSHQQRNSSTFQWENKILKNNWSIMFNSP